MNFNDLDLVTGFPRLEDMEQHGPYVYFIRHGEFVKIGTSINPASRLKALSRRNRQTIGCPAPLGDMELVACVPGSARDERLWHKRFAHLRSEGEWFRLHEDLRESVADAWRQQHECEARLGGFDLNSYESKLAYLRKMPVLERVLDPIEAFAYDLGEEDWEIFCEENPELLAA